jgi:hypothetical protein
MSLIILAVARPQVPAPPAAIPTSSQVLEGGIKKIPSNYICYRESIKAARKTEATIAIHDRMFAARPRF